ncbi:MAG: amidase [Rhodospirillales bacterium]|nr:amidase [Rhodospirillales bacterium]
MATHNLPPDPFRTRSLAAYGEDLRSGRVSAEAVTRAFLDRIEALNPRLDAFIHVAAEPAMKTARGIDQLLAGGTDLGPLMGVPVAIKDLFAVDGMPTGAGSRLDVEKDIGPEGSFIKSLKRAGCILLGKARTVEFALGAFNDTHPLPWNPWSPSLHRMPGGSSHGSAVAQAAGLSALAIGTDTGGSVRMPASYCGTVGFKASPELWPKDGLMPLNPVIDSLGTFTNTVADACYAYAALTGDAEPRSVAPRTLRLGKPVNYFFEGLESEVADAIDEALSRLAGAGVEIVPCEVPHVNDFQDFYLYGGVTSVVGYLGGERVKREYDLIDRYTRDRLKNAFDYSADRYVALYRGREAMARAATEAIRGLDGWVTPTTVMVAAPFEEIAKGPKRAEWIARNARNTRIFNVLGFCGLSFPLVRSDLPVGLQIAAPARTEARLLAVARTIEDVLGTPPKPDVSGFLEKKGRGEMT